MKMKSTEASTVNDHGWDGKRPLLSMQNKFHHNIASNTYLYNLVLVSYLLSMVNEDMQKDVLQRHEGYGPSAHRKPDKSSLSPSLKAYIARQF